MLKSFLQIAIRSFARRKGYSLLNLLGLTIGISCCLLIFEYVAYERSYDSFQPQANRIFRVQESDYQNGRFEVNWATTSPAVGPALNKDFPEVENFCRLFNCHLLLSNDARNIRFSETKSYIADAAALTLLDLPLVKGNPATALKGANKIVISEDMARKYFGTEDPLGNALTVRNGGRLTSLEVTGVFKNYPLNSHLVLDVLISYPTLHQSFGAGDATNDPTETTWTWNDYYTYIELKKGTDPVAFQNKLRPFIDRHYNSLPENKAHNDFNTLQLFALTDIHLYSHYGEEAETNGDGSSVSFLFLIAFFIAAIAWINYINLSTARSLERAREVGVRKVLGALRTDLIGQFLVESLLLNGLALLLAMIVAWVASPLFNQFTGRALHTPFFLPLTYCEIFAGLFLGGTFLSGIYPTFALSRYHPVSVLKGLFKNTAGGQLLRKALIVGQFAASILLIAGTIIVYNQVHYMRSQALGANISQTLVLSGINSMKDSTYQNIFPSFRNDLLRIRDVKGITGSTNVMGQEITWSTTWLRLGGASKTNYTLLHLGFDYDFIQNFGLKIIAGRGFSRDFATDKHAVLLNESAVRELGYTKPADALGQLLYGGQSSIDTVHVIGVVVDFHHEGLQKSIQPLALLLRTGSANFYSVKIGTGNTPQTIAAVKKVWESHFPADPFQYFFLDEYFNHQYAENERFGTVFGLFAGLAIAFVIAVPLTWWAMNTWLQEFAYRIHISWLTFAIAGILAFGIALITVGLQALKATLANPVKSLRTE